MKAIKLANTQSERGRLKQRCTSALARAEQIKKIKQWPLSVDNVSSTFPSPQPLKVPHSSRGLSTREEVILLEGSKLHGLLFPTWTTEPNDDEFRDVEGHYYVYVSSHASFFVLSNSFRDPSEIAISPSHIQDLAGWKRPTELLNSTFTGDLESLHAINKPTMLASADIDLVQDVTADCSVVASLCAMVARPGGRFGRVG
jgi:calpain-7